MGQPTDGMTVAATSRAGRELHAHVPVPKPERMSGWRMGAAGVLAQKAAEPRTAFAADDVVGVDPVGNVGDRRDVPAHDDGGIRR